MFSLSGMEENINQRMILTKRVLSLSSPHCNQSDSSMVVTNLTTMIETEEGQEIATYGIPNVLIQTQVEGRDDEGN